SPLRERALSGSSSSTNPVLFAASSRECEKNKNKKSREKKNSDTLSRWGGSTGPYGACRQKAPWHAPCRASAVGCYRQGPPVTALSSVLPVQQLNRLCNTL